MKKRLVEFGLMLLAMINCSILFTGVCMAQIQTNLPKINPWIPQVSTNPPPGFATRLDYMKSFKDEKMIYDAYHSGMLNKDEAITAMSMNKLSLNDKSPMDAYGKVVDQSGKPVAGAAVQGFLEFEERLVKDEKHNTTTDAEGRFCFIGLHGKGLGILPEKKGYEYNIRYATKRPQNYLPDPTNPLIFTMWKLKGSESLAHYDVESSIPRDGTTNNFNLLTGKKDVSGGLMAQLLRDPLEIAPENLRKPFSWSLTLTITNGGLLEYFNQPYPYEAPGEGYQKVVTLNFPTNMVDWQSWAKRNYYFNDGRVYGRMTIEVHAGAPTPEAFFEINAFANPNGSRNLEFDPQKQIR